jgi:hypothetical protein
VNDNYNLSISQMSMDLFIFLVDFIFPLSPTRLLPDLTL